MLVFDAKVQFKSNEITEETFEKIIHHSNEMLEHMTHENSEIENIQRIILRKSKKEYTPLMVPTRNLQ